MKNAVLLLCLSSGIMLAEPIVVAPTYCSQGMNFPDGSQMEDSWCSISATAGYRTLEDGYLLEIEGFATSIPPAGDPMNWMMGTADLLFVIATDEQASETRQTAVGYEYEQSGFVQGIENNVLCCNGPFPVNITLGASNGGNIPSYDSYFKMSVRANMLVWQDDGGFASYPVRPFLVDTEFRGNVESFAMLSPEPAALAVLAPEPAGWQLLTLGASVFAFIQLRSRRSVR